MGKGFTITCNECGEAVVINGSSGSTIGDISFSHEDVYVDLYTYPPTMELYLHVGCQKCDNQIRGSIKQ